MHVAFTIAEMPHRNGAHRRGAALNRASTKIMDRRARRSVRHHAMTILTLLEEAEQVGKSKSTLWGASKRGEPSVKTKDEAGQILVDSSELFRVFQAKRGEPRVITQYAAVNATHEADDTALRLAVAETKIEALHAMVQELQRARDA